MSHGRNKGWKKFGPVGSEAFDLQEFVDGQMA